MKIQTKRLELVSATFDYHSAELESPEKLGALLNATVDAGWPPGEYDRPAQEFFRDKARDGGDRTIGWSVWYIILKRTGKTSRILVGAGGFFGPPDKEGTVEVGFSIMPLQRGKGFATEFLTGLIEWAFEDNRVKGIVAQTTNGNGSALRVINKTGFMKTGAEGKILIHRLTKDRFFHITTMTAESVATATDKDFDGWLELAKEVEPLFGPMAAEKTFHDHLKKSIAEKSCFCIRSSTAARKLRGAIAVSFSNNEISWFAVSKDERGKGLGRLLLTYALARLNKAKDIFVQTFAESSVEGRAARALYSAFGFQDYKTGEPTPTGIPTISMRKRAESSLS